MLGSQQLMGKPEVILPDWPVSEAKRPSKLTIHDECVDEAACWMFKRFRQTANDFEAKALPKPNRAIVGADHEIVLHGSEPAFAGALE